MKVTFICPKRVGGFSRISFLKFPSQALIQLASMTPPEWEVEVIDENYQPIDFDKRTDLVALTGMTTMAPRAFEIAAEYRNRYVQTVMGGIHASMCPEETARYVDCVVVGEAEGMWAKILADFARGEMLRRYDCPQPTCLDFVQQRRVSRIFEVSCLGFKVRNAYIQTQRGCPWDCEFCSVHRFNGPRIRSKSLPYLIEEIATEKAAGFDYLCFIDDNIIARPDYARQLFQKLRPLGVRWLSQMDIRIGEIGGHAADTESLLDLACESGLQAAMFGLESVSADVLKAEVHGPKHVWRKHYETVIRKLRDRGVLVYVTFIFGFDGEPRNAAADTVRWAKDNGINFADFCILTPLLGTSLHESMSRQGRILTRDWSLYDTHHCVFKPVDREAKEIEEQAAWANAQFYTLPSIIGRNNPRAPFRNQMISLLTNFQFRGYL